MKTLTAQRLKKQAEKDYKNQEAMLELIWEQAQAELKKLATFLTVPEDISPRKGFRLVVEEYREDDEASYLEQGVIER